MINWTRIQRGRWLGVCQAGHYHAVFTVSEDRRMVEKQCYWIIFIPLDTKQKPVDLGRRSTEANAKYCAEMHHRLTTGEQQS